jgi:hypothetical protein
VRGADGSTGIYGDPVNLLQAMTIAIYGGFYAENGIHWEHSGINSSVTAGCEFVVTINPVLETVNGFGYYIGLRGTELQGEIQLGWLTLNVLPAGAATSAEHGHSVYGAQFSSIDTVDFHHLIGAVGSDCVAGLNGGAGAQCLGRAGSGGDDAVEGGSAGGANAGIEQVPIQYELGIAGIVGGGADGYHTDYVLYRLYLGLGSTPRTRQNFSRESINKALTIEAIAGIRHCANTGLVLGTEKFIDQVDSMRSRDLLWHFTLTPKLEIPSFG